MQAQIINIKQGEKNGKQWRIASMVMQFTDGPEPIRLFLRPSDPILRPGDKIEAEPRLYANNDGGVGVSFNITIVK